MLDQLKCSADGLSGDEVVKRLEAVGPNRRPDRTTGAMAEGNGKDHHAISRRAHALW